MTSFSEDLSALSPLIYWKLNESSGTSAADSGSLGLAGTLTNGGIFGATGVVPNLSDTSLDLDGSNDYVNRASDNGMRLTSWSVVVSVNLDAATGAIASRWGLSTDRAWAADFYGTSGAVRFYPMNTNGTSFVATGNVPSTGTRYLYVFTFDASDNKARIYRNGSLEASSGALTGTIANNGGTGALRVGTRDVSGDYLDGKVGHFAYLSGALSSTQVSDLYSKWVSQGVTGTIAATLPKLTAAASGTVLNPRTGTIAATLPKLTAALAGTVTNPPNVTGTIAATLPALDVTASGSHTNPGGSATGTIAATLPALTAAAVATEREPFETTPPEQLDPVTGGTYRYRTVLRVSDGTTGQALDVDDGTYTFDAGSVPQRRLTAQVWPATTDEADLLDVDADVSVRVVASTLDGTAQVSVPLVPLWVQEVRKEVGSEGTRYTVDAVDILGRLSDNGLTGPLQVADGASVVGTIRRLLNSAGHHHGVSVELDGSLTDADVPEKAVYDGDPVAAAQELADTIGGMLVSMGRNVVRVVKPPALGGEEVQYLADTVTHYTAVAGRAPTRVVVETTSTNGEQDVRGTAGGAGSGRYGTVTRTFSRPAGTSPDTAATRLLRRLGGRGYRLEQVELIPNPGIVFGTTVKVRHSGAARAVVWAYDLPLAPTQPMRLRMRQPEEEGT